MIIEYDLPQILVSQVKLEFRHFLFLNSDVPPVPEEVDLGGVIIP
jgi:hypothetical protein